MPEIEAGVFIGFILTAFAGIVFVTRLPYLLILSAIIFAGLSLLMFGYYNVVMTTLKQAVAETNETAIGNTTITSFTYAEVPEKTHFINSDHDTWGWIFMAMSIGTTFFFFRVKF